MFYRCSVNKTVLMGIFERSIKEERDSLRNDNDQVICAELGKGFVSQYLAVECVAVKGIGSLFVNSSSDKFICELRTIVEYLETWDEEYYLVYLTILVVRAPSVPFPACSIEDSPRAVLNHISSHTIGGPMCSI